MSKMSEAPKYKPLSKPIEEYERTDYKQLAKEFGGIRIGKRLIKFFPKDPNGRPYKLFQVIPLTGWYTDPKAIEHIQRERGFEL